MSTVLDFPPLDTAGPPANNLPAAIDLQALALSRFGDWRPKAAALVAKYKGVIFDVTTPKGLADATAARLEVRAPRYAAQNVSKASKSELARVSKAIGAEEQAIIDALAATEEHIDGQIKAGEARMAAEKAERDRIEAERVAKHRAGIDTIKGYVAQAQGKTAAQIQAGITVLEGLHMGSETWGDFTAEAGEALAATLRALDALVLQAQAREAEAARIEAQRIENARVAAEQAERQRKLEEQHAELNRRMEALLEQEGAAIAKLQRFEAELAAQNSQRQESGAQTDPNTTGNGNMAHQTEHAAPLGGPAEGEGASAPSPGSSSEATDLGRDEIPPTGDQYLPASQPAATSSDDLMLLRDALAFTKYAAAPFFGKFPSHPKTTPEWWAGLREQIECLQPLLIAAIDVGEGSK